MAKRSDSRGCSLTFSALRKTESPRHSAVSVISSNGARLALRWTSPTEADSMQYVDTIGLGWWIAGDIRRWDNCRPVGSATYAGNTIGTVLQRSEGRNGSHISAPAKLNSLGISRSRWAIQYRTSMRERPDIGPLNATGPCGFQTSCAPTARNRFNGPISGTVGQLSDVRRRCLWIFRQARKRPNSGRYRQLARGQQ